MKNSIRAILAMFAILPCALFFTACGGEKVETAQAQQVYTEAVTATSEITTDFKIDTKMKYEIKDGSKTNKTNITSVIKKTGEVTEVGGVKNYDNVRLYSKVVGESEQSDEVNGYKYWVDSETVLGKVGDYFYSIDNKNKTYEKEYDYVSDFADDIFDLFDDNMGDQTMTPSSFIELDFESETLKVTTEKFGDKKYVITAKGYEIMNGMKLEGTAKITLKDGKVAEVSYNFKGYTPKEGVDVSKDADNASLYTEKVMSAECTVKVTYGKQSIAKMPTSLDGYTQAKTIFD